MEEKNKKRGGASIGGVVFVGCMFIGAGVGMILGHKETGGAIGMGVGFLAMGGIMAYYRNKE